MEDVKKLVGIAAAIGVVVGIAIFASYLVNYGLSAAENGKLNVTVG